MTVAMIVAETSFIGFIGPPKLRVLCHMMQCGKTAGLVTGITAAEGVDSDHGW
ncbi:MAG: hypothetical protein R3E60_00490 [Alphaproteobacteria bacterium]